MSKLDPDLQAFDISQALCLQALADPYFSGLANVDREPSTQPISKLEFEFERRKLTEDDVRELIYREVLHVCCFGIIWLLFIIQLNPLIAWSEQILEYHPQMLQEYLRGGDQTSFMYPRLENTYYSKLD